MAELRNPTAPRWDWDRYLRPHGECFPRGITTADLDAEIEINRRFLVLEGKRDGEAMKFGQRYAMDQRVTDGRTVIVVYGDPPGEIKALRQWPHGDLIAATWETLWVVCHSWATWAEQAGAPAERPCEYRIPADLQAAA